jgi:N-ethylmaleimide reductase
MGCGQAKVKEEELKTGKEVTTDKKKEELNTETKGKEVSEMPNLLSPIKFCGLDLRNRVVMAAMTRCRCDPSLNIPNEIMVKYYSERAENAAFVLTECTAISQRSIGYPGGAGIWNDEQVEGWKKVTEACHQKGGKIFLQIWHTGRIAFSWAIGGQQPLAPSAIRSTHKMRTPDGEFEYDDPLEMTKEDIEEVKEQFRRGAINAKTGATRS